MNNRKSGFTLIELLVVVAIIAILAAIAVPNFLAAQTRAKVSRSQTDMRTLATGLEMFRVDNNRYPPDAEVAIGGGPLTYFLRLKFLTTPVAYLTAVPEDPFANEGRIREFAATEGGGINAYAHPTTSDNFVYPLTYDYANRLNLDGSWETDATWKNIASNPSSIHWGIRSVGPDLWPAWLGMPVAGYDPTNGTASTGNIYWTGPGTGVDAPRI